MDAQKEITRRRFLSVCAVAGAFSAMPFSTVLASAPLHHWRGILLGAEVGLTLAHPNKQKANNIFPVSYTHLTLPTILLV